MIFDNNIDLRKIMLAIFSIMLVFGCTSTKLTIKTKLPTDPRLPTNKVDFFVEIPVSGETPAKLVAALKESAVPYITAEEVFETLSNQSDFTIVVQQPLKEMQEKIKVYGYQVQWDKMFFLMLDSFELDYRIENNIIYVFKKSV